MTANLEKLGYAQAQSSDSLEDRANEAMDAIPGFPEEVSAEARDALYRGYRRRWAERNPAKVYAIIGGNYTLATPEILSNKKVEKIEVGMDYAFSFSTHEYGKLGQENPQLRKIVEDIRTSAQDYCSNRLGDLKRAAKKILNKAQGGVTRETKSFEESAKKVFSDWEKSVKTKASRGDASAKPDKFKAAVASFWKAYNA
jgi:hypothetical protein